MICNRCLMFGAFARSLPLRFVLGRSGKLAPNRSHLPGNPRGSQGLERRDDTEYVER